MVPCLSPSSKALSFALLVTVTSRTVVRAEIAELVLIDPLDSITSNYCLDIVGENEEIDIVKGLQAYTCYSSQGDLGADQVFETNDLSSGILYMPVYDVCATASAIEAGAKIGLVACSDSEQQTFAFGTSGTISPVLDSRLCVTASSETRFGQSDNHQIADLSLAECSFDLVRYQEWGYRTTMEGDISYLPGGVVGGGTTTEEGATTADEAIDAISPPVIRDSVEGESSSPFVASTVAPTYGIAAAVFVSLAL